MRVALAGAVGKTGREVARGILAAPDLTLVAALDHHAVGDDLASPLGLATPTGVTIGDDLGGTLDRAKPEVFVDFTRPDGVMDNLQAALSRRIACVVGTTGFTAERLAHVKAWCAEYQTPCLIAANFSVGAVLMMRFAEQAAAHFPDAEIIEMHPPTKKDAPSGTARLTADRIEQARSGGGAAVPIHSVRLPGLVAHQAVLFGGPGETLTIRHDTTSREAFVPGVLLAIRMVRSLAGLTIGIDALLSR